MSLGQPPNDKTYKNGRCNGVTTGSQATFNVLSTVETVSNSTTATTLVCNALVYSPNTAQTGYVLTAGDNGQVIWAPLG
jgi:hypothetical protein